MAAENKINCIQSVINIITMRSLKPPATFISIRRDRQGGIKTFIVIDLFIVTILTHFGVATLGNQELIPSEVGGGN